MGHPVHCPLKESAPQSHARFTTTHETWAKMMMSFFFLIDDNFQLVLLFESDLRICAYVKNCKKWILSKKEESLYLLYWSTDEDLKAAVVNLTRQSLEIIFDNSFFHFILNGSIKLSLKTQKPIFTDFFRKGLIS